MKKYIVGVLFFFIVFSIIIIFNSNILATKSYTKPPQELIYDSDTELKPYIDKFFRDLNNYNIYPVIPKNFTVKLSDLDAHSPTTHAHGISYGFEDDDLVEIYINKRSWEAFNKSLRYYIIYHELSHDILNLDDLSDNDNNFGKIMYPSISNYQNTTMDDFISNMKLLFDSL